MSIGIRREFAIIAVVLAVGCSDAPRGERSFEVFPTTGVVHVDGQPAEFVQVDCRPDDDSSTIKYSASTMTNKDGRFELTTYESGDGLPEGTYTLSFRWLEPSLAARDKFKGKYANPNKSQHKITVVKGQKNDIGVIELSSKGPSQ